VNFRDVSIGNTWNPNSKAALTRLTLQNCSAS
jgi:hypothetical protein